MDALCWRHLRPKHPLFRNRFCNTEWLNRNFVFQYNNNALQIHRGKRLFLGQQTLQWKNVQEEIAEEIINHGPALRKVKQQSCRLIFSAALLSRILSETRSVVTEIHTNFFSFSKNKHKKNLMKVLAILIQSCGLHFGGEPKDSLIWCGFTLLRSKLDSSL